MEIKITIKQAGRKRPVYKPMNISVSGNEKTLLEFIKTVVRSQVDSFNERRSGDNFITYLTSPEIEEQSKLGKVSFGEVNDSTLADYNKAIETAMLAYEDGLFKVFIDDNMCEKLDDNIELKENSEVIFIRLTFLVGRGY